MLDPRPCSTCGRVHNPGVPCQEGNKDGSDQETQSFNDMKLSDISYTPMDSDDLPDELSFLAGEDILAVNEKPMRFDLNGADFTVQSVRAERTAEVKGAEIVYSRAFNYLVGDGERPEILTGRMAFDYGDWEVEGEPDTYKEYDLPIVRMLIQKNPTLKKRPEYRGLGLVMAQKAMEHFINLEAQGQAFVVEFWHDTDLGLDREKWDKVFVPTLETLGFKKHTDGHWFKVYGSEEDVDFEQYN